MLHTTIYGTGENDGEISFFNDDFFSVSTTTLVLVRKKKTNRMLKS